MLNCILLLYINNESIRYDALLLINLKDNIANVVCCLLCKNFYILIGQMLSRIGRHTIKYWVTDDYLSDIRSLGYFLDIYVDNLLLQY